MLEHFKYFSVYPFVKIVIRLWCGHPKNCGLMPGGRKKIFTFPKYPDKLGPTQTPLLWVLGTLSLAVKWLCHQANHSLPSSVWWDHDSTPHICLHDMHRDNFTYSWPVPLLMLSKMKFFSVMKSQVPWCTVWCASTEFRMVKVQFVGFIVCKMFHSFLV